MHFSSALALARRPWPWPSGPSLGYASAEASGPRPGPRPGPLGLGRCLRKAFFSAHFSKAGLLILERQNIQSSTVINDFTQLKVKDNYEIEI